MGRLEEAIKYRKSANSKAKTTILMTILIVFFTGSTAVASMMEPHADMLAFFIAGMIVLGMALIAARLAEETDEQQVKLYREINKLNKKELKQYLEIRK